MKQEYKERDIRKRAKKVKGKQRENRREGKDKAKHGGEKIEKKEYSREKREKKARR